MNLAIILLPERIVEALGWTLFHALWQGALIALVFAVILYFSHRYSARVRYGLGLAALALTLLMSTLTFWNHYAAGGPAGPAAAAVRSVTTAPGPGVAVSAPEPAAGGEGSRSQRLVSFFSDYFARHLPLIVTLWLLGVLFLTLRFSGGMLYVQRLKYRQNRPLPQQWQERLEALVKKAGLQRPLQLLESLRLHTPVVIGHLKPVLLLPAGLVTGLPADEVEAPLAHELAHVMRRDYLVNVLQNLVEILYFFHPGVRWISAGVRQEREHCCDDFAVALCGDPSGYARALARLQVEGMAYPEPALAAAGRGHMLLRRIARLLGRPRLVHDFREGFVSALLLVFGLLAMLKLAAASGVPVTATAGSVPSEGTGSAGSVPVSGSAQTTAALQTPVANRFAFVSFDLEADGFVKLVGEGGAVTGGSPSTWLVNDRDGQVIWYMDLSARGQAGGKGSFSEEVPLARGTYSWYRPGGWKATAQWKRAGGEGAWEPLTMFVGSKERYLTSRRDRGEELLKAEQEYQLQQQAALEAEQELQEQKLLKQETRAQAEYERQLKEEEVQKLAQEIQHLNEKERRLKEKELQKLEQELAARTETEQEMKQQELKEHQQELRARELALQARLQEEKMVAETQAMRVRVEQLKAEEQRLRSEENNFQALIRELAAAGLVSQSEGYEVKLSAKALLVNGKKQPPAVHERIRKFYEGQIGEKLSGERTVTIVDDKD